MHGPCAVGPPVTMQRLIDDLRELGVGQGQTLLVHASLSSIGWVDGGAATVVAALRQVVGETAGTVVVSTGTEQNSQTSRAHQNLVKHMTADEARTYRRDMPAFDRDTTPGSAGAIAEALRTTNGAVRSAHPQSSLAAIGPKAEGLMADHPLKCHLGEQSPLAKLYKLDAQVLLLGVGYRSCTAFHLAEYRYTKNPPTQFYSCVVTENGRRKWKKYRDVVLDDNDFDKIGKRLEDVFHVKKGCVGNAESRLLPLAIGVDHATSWMRENRTLLCIAGVRNFQKQKRSPIVISLANVGALSD
jgi:aminoglycoside 3-N-acetyltransferase